MNGHTKRNGARHRLTRAEVERIEARYECKGAITGGGHHSPGSVKRVMLYSGVVIERVYELHRSRYYLVGGVWMGPADTTDRRSWTDRMLHELAVAQGRR